MIPGEYDFSVYKGGRLNHKITAVDAMGVAVDFGDYASARMQIRPLWMQTATGTMPTAIASLTTDNGGIYFEDAGLTMMLYMSATDTAALINRKLRYDIELVLASGDVDKFLYGTITIMDEVTV